MCRLAPPSLCRPCRNRRRRRRVLLITDFIRIISRLHNGRFTVFTRPFPRFIVFCLLLVPFPARAQLPARRSSSNIRGIEEEIDKMACCCASDATVDRKIITFPRLFVPSFSSRGSCSNYLFRLHSLRESRSIPSSHLTRYIR